MSGEHFSSSVIYLSICFYPVYRKYSFIHCLKSLNVSDMLGIIQSVVGISLSAMVNKYVYTHTANRDIAFVCYAYVYVGKDNSREGVL